MKTRNEFKTYVILWVIAFIIFNVLVFIFWHDVIAGRYTDEVVIFQDGAYGVKKVLTTDFLNMIYSYIFVALGFIGQIICAKIFLSQDSLRKTMYHYPLFNISLVGLVLTFIFALIFCIAKIKPVISLIIFLVTLFYTVFRCLSAKTAANLVSAKEENIELKTQYMKLLRAESESLANRVRDEKIQKLVKNVADEVRFSDPLSVPELIDTEKAMIEKFNELKENVSSNDYNKIKSICDDFSDLLKDRNSKVKSLKK